MSAHQQTPRFDDEGYNKLLVRMTADIRRPRRPAPSAPRQRTTTTLVDAMGRDVQVQLLADPPPNLDGLYYFVVSPPTPGSR